MLLRVSIVLLLITFAAYAQVENLVINPSFEEDEVILDDPNWQGWATWGFEKGLNSKVAIDKTESIDESRSLKVEPKGDIDWHFIVLNMPMDVSKGKTYTISFWAKAQAERPIAARLKATDNSIDFCLTNLGPIIPEWKEFRFTCEPQATPIKFEIYCAGSDTPFWLDFVNLYQGKPVEDLLPSKYKVPKSVEPDSKLATRWAELKIMH